MMAFALIALALNVFLFIAASDRVETTLSVLGLISSTFLLLSSLAA